MYIVLFTSILALIFTLLESRGVIRNGMKIAFFLLTLLGVIHYDYGNDYMAYYGLFEKLSSEPFDLRILFDDDGYRDKGWVILCQLFDRIGGFFVMVAVLNIIQNICVYRFIKATVDKKWLVVAVFIYSFTTSLYLLNFSMMRQGFVACVFLGIWKFIIERKWLLSVIILYLCSLIHSSAILLLPFAFWGYVPTGNGRFWACLYGALLFLLWQFGPVLNYIFERFMVIEEFSEYNETYSGVKNTAMYGLGFILGLIPFFIALYYLFKNKDNDVNKKIVLLSMLSFVVTPFTQIVPLLGRVGIYFTIYQLAAIPIVYKSIPKKVFRVVCICLYVLILSYSYWGFFNRGVFAEPYRTFHTIFEVL